VRGTRVGRQALGGRSLRLLARLGGDVGVQSLLPDRHLDRHVFGGSGAANCGEANSRETQLTKLGQEIYLRAMSCSHRDLVVFLIQFITYS
jgi:hypothetical protein